MNGKTKTAKKDQLRLWQRLAVASYVFLILDILVWETWGAPPKQVSVYFGLTMKLLPLLVPLLPVWRGNAGVYMWVSILMLFYITEGLVLSYSEYGHGWGLHNELVYAVIEMGLSIAFVFCAGTYIRLKNPRIKKS
ncbi:MAG: DUF2069 domain-containing protein [Acidiferrobacterales bacterium]